MPTINDYKKKSLNNSGYSGPIVDAEYKWLRAQVSPYKGSIPDMWMKFLYNRGFTTGPLPYRLSLYLKSLGYTGSLPNMLYQYWKNGAAPAWAAGSNLWANFALDGLNGDTSYSITDTHGQTIYAPNAAGVYLPFASNVLVRTDLGLQNVPTRTNLFLNSFAPVTQSVTVVNATIYTVSITGTGSVTLSGAGTGVVTAGSPVTFTAGSTSLTCTVAGSPSTCNVEAGSFATPPIQTAGSSATVNNNQPVISGLSANLVYGAAGIVQFNNLQPGVSGGFGTVFSLSAGTGGSVDRISFYRNQTGQYFFDVFTSTVNQASMNVPPVQSVGQTLTFVYVVSNNYVKVQCVGQADIAADTTVSYPVGLSQMNIGVTSGLGTAGYQFTKKIALDFLTPSDDPATKFTEWYAKAQLA